MKEKEGNIFGIYLDLMNGGTKELLVAISFILPAYFAVAGTSPIRKKHYTEKHRVVAIGHIPFRRADYNNALKSAYKN